MEVFWYIIAALGAGIGTGLAGLSAATVMVPILIVLCPSFSGETGAYQATAIALASDILVTGAVLTLLGASMILLNFWPRLSEIPLVVQTLTCFGTLVTYIIPAVLVLLLIYFFTKVPPFVFRKLLHAVAFTCFTVMLLSAEDWMAAAVTSIGIAVLLYPVLALVEKEKWYGKIFVEKSPGEIKMSLLKLFFMFAVVITAAWGIFDKRQAAAAAILMWGVGDAAAALIGIPFGRHKVMFQPVCGRKSWEGTAAMFAASFLIGMAMLMLNYDYKAAEAAMSVFPGAVVGAATELISPSEWDTVTVPVAILAVLLLTL